MFVLILLSMLILTLFYSWYYANTIEKYLKVGLTDLLDIINGIVLQFWLYLPLGLIGHLEMGRLDIKENMCTILYTSLGIWTFTK